MDEGLRKRLSRRVRQLVREHQYAIDPHSHEDYPQRKIGVDDILVVLKVGEIKF